MINFGREWDWMELQQREELGSEEGRVDPIVEDEG
jgi:hypothetical protein